MKKYHLDRRIALFGAVLVLGGSAALVVGSGALGSHPSRTQTTAHSMAGMPTAQPTSAAAAAAAVVRLHQHVVNVSIHNFAFGPARLVVSPGTRIGFHKAANKNVNGTFEEAVRRINALPQRPAFVMHTGDHVHLSTMGEFDTVRQIMSTIKSDRTFNVRGEHDVFVDQGKRYLQVFGQGSRG